MLSKHPAYLYTMHGNSVHDISGSSLSWGGSETHDDGVGHHATETTRTVLISVRGYDGTQMWAAGCSSFRVMSFGGEHVHAADDARPPSLAVHDIYDSCVTHTPVGSC